MRIPYKEILNRFNGISIGTPLVSAGINWTPTELEIDKARRVVAFCEDRRILFAPHNWEMRRESVDSAVAIREFLTEELGSLNRKTDFSKKLEDMRKSCRTFLDSLRSFELHYGSHDYNMVSGPPRDALNSLRSSCALDLLWIVITFQLDVEDDLARCFDYVIKD